MGFTAFLLALLLLGGTSRAESLPMEQESAAESDNDVQQSNRSIVGIHDYKSELTSRSQMLEAIANGGAVDKWTLSRGGDEKKLPWGKQVKSSIVYLSPDGYAVYSLAIRCDHAYTPDS